MLERLIQTAQERELPDLVLKNGKIVNDIAAEGMLGILKPLGLCK